MPRFRCRSKNFIITYPQVGEDVQHRFDNPSDLIEIISRNIRDPLCARLGREHHQDGGVHYHLYLGFDKIVSINKPDAFDYYGPHGNIKSIRRTPEKVHRYVGKDNDIRLDYGEPPDSTGSDSGGNRNKWHDIVSSEDKDTFLSAVREQAPRDWLLSNQRILEYANLYYPEEIPEYETPTISIERERYPELTQWEEQASIGNNRPER